VSQLIDANFVAEVETFVLTARHDAARLQGPISIDVSREGDQLIQMNGTTRAIRAGDIVMRDAIGVCCSILYGQDNRSAISSSIQSFVSFLMLAPHDEETTPNIGFGHPRFLAPVGSGMRAGTASATGWHG
jgi:DNA/RNA-binding domain of Phe-tRNA-synthetase-like protein